MQGGGEHKAWTVAKLQDVGHVRRDDDACTSHGAFEHSVPKQQRSRAEIQSLWLAAICSFLHPQL